MSYTDLPMKFLPSSCVILVGIVVSGCGSGGSGSTDFGRNPKVDSADASARDSRDDGGSSKPLSNTIDCYTETCNAVTEYCLLSTSKTVTMAARCMTLPLNCHSCDCLPSDMDVEWRKKSNTANCDGAMYMCSSSQHSDSTNGSSSQVTLDCHKGSL